MEFTVEVQLAAQEKEGYHYVRDDEEDTTPDLTTRSNNKEEEDDFPSTKELGSLF